MQDGYTEVRHGDLVSAVENWKLCTEKWREVVIEAEKYEENTWRNLPLCKRLWLNVSCGIYKPEEKIMFKWKYIKDNVSDFCWKNRYYIGYFSYGTKINDARSVEKHLYYGKHYLTGDQVEFVNKFKDMK